MTSCGGGTISYGLGRKHDAVTGLLSLRERLTELGTIPLPEATAAARAVLDELRANGKARDAAWRGSSELLTNSPNRIRTSCWSGSRNRPTCSAGDRSRKSGASRGSPSFPLGQAARLYPCGRVPLD